MQETLVYLFVFGRWVLPRMDLSRMALSDLLLDYLGKASDLMELYALFDEDLVRTNLLVTHLILVVWSVSFLQFVPVLIHNHKYRMINTIRWPCVSRSCMRNLPEIVDTFATFCLQDGPFLCLRLFVMIKLDLLTYSLVFFVIKNAFMLVLLTYRFVILVCKRPCACFTECVSEGDEEDKGKESTTDDVEYITNEEEDASKMKEIKSHE